MRHDPPAMNPHRYAQGTSVPVEKTKSEIERLVRGNGATGFATAWTGDRFSIAFEMKNRRCRFELAAPDRKKFHSVGKWEAEERRRWRALLLIIKAKMEVVASGDADFEAEFLANIILPDGHTIGERIIPALDGTMDGKPLPPLLPG